MVRQRDGIAGLRGEHGIAGGAGGGFYALPFGPDAHALGGKRNA